MDSPFSFWVPLTENWTPVLSFRSAAGSRFVWGSKKMECGIKVGLEGCFWHGFTGRGLRIPAQTGGGESLFSDRPEETTA